MSVEYSLHDIIMKLNGPIEPVGDSGLDLERLANLKQLGVTVDLLLSEMAQIADLHDHHAHSIQEAGKLARSFIEDYREITKKGPPDYHFGSNYTN